MLVLDLKVYEIFKAHFGKEEALIIMQWLEEKFNTKK